MNSIYYFQFYQNLFSFHYFLSFFPFMHTGWKSKGVNGVLDGGSQNFTFYCIFVSFQPKIIPTGSPGFYPQPPLYPLCASMVLSNKRPIIVLSFVYTWMITDLMLEKLKRKDFREKYKVISLTRSLLLLPFLWNWNVFVTFAGRGKTVLWVLKQILSKESNNFTFKSAKQKRFQIKHKTN